GTCKGLKAVWEKYLEVTFREKEWNVIVPQMLLPMRDALAAKGMPDSLTDVLDSTVKMVNLVKTRPLNYCVFSALCNDMGSDHVTLLQHTEVLWLSRGKLKVFFTDHNFHLSDRLHEDEFLTRLVYLGDVFSSLNDLNLGLQGLSATIFNVQNKIDAMIKKFFLVSSSLSALTRTTHRSFHHRMIFLCVNELKLTDNVKCDIAKHLSELGAQLRRYFPETDDTNNWIRYPFHALPPVHLPISEQESLIVIATIEFNQKLLPDFWIGLHSEYPALANRAVKTLMPFATIKYRHRLCVENDLRLRLSNTTQHCRVLCILYSHLSH
uniref:Uncharacterized protein n=1 Tax=Oncorhynchus kisutch TaxID=8019 RepID=A0A8C7KYS0_ONCKI